MLLFKLFFAFIQVGMFSVGGGYAAIPLIQEQIVNIYGLMTLEEFSDLITVAEMTPGPISINSATFVGMRLAAGQITVLPIDGITAGRNINLVIHKNKYLSKGIIMMQELVPQLFS